MSWHQVGGVMDAGDIGGDMQWGEAPSVRYQHDEKPGSLVTVSIYPIRHDDNDGCPGECVPGTFDLQERIEYLVCADPDDPGGTELWSDYVDDSPLADRDGTDLDLPDEETAVSEARRLLSYWTPGYVAWNGDPEYG